LTLAISKCVVVAALNVLVVVTPNLAAQPKGEKRGEGVGDRDPVRE
jgi:hypothetical protein